MHLSCLPEQLLRSSEQLILMDTYKRVLLGPDCLCCRSLKKSHPVVTVGFEVDEIKKVEPRDCMVRLTAYHRGSGNVRFVTVYHAVAAGNS